MEKVLFRLAWSTTLPIAITALLQSISCPTMWSADQKGWEVYSPQHGINGRKHMCVVKTVFAERQVGCQHRPVGHSFAVVVDVGLHADARFDVLVTSQRTFVKQNREAV